MRQLPETGVEEGRQGTLRDHLGYAGADQVRAQQVVALGVRDHLDHAVRLAQDQRLAVRAQVSAARLEPAAGLACLLLGEADAGHLRAAVGGAGQARVIYGRTGNAGDRLGGQDALRRGDVREQEAARDVAHGEHARYVRVQRRIDRREAAIELHAGLFQADAGGQRLAPRGYEQTLGAQVFRLLAGPYVQLDA